MKILHLSTSLNGGAGIAARRIAESQSQNGMDVELWSGNSRDNELKKYEKVVYKNVTKIFLSRIITVFQSKLIQNSDFLVTPFSLKTLSLRDIEESGFDLIHLHATYNFTNLSSIRKYFPAIPIVVTMHDQRTFTGGCHYSIGCEQYKLECKKCPQVEPIWNWLPSRVLNKEFENSYEESFVTFVTPSIWLAEKASHSNLLRNSRIKVIRNPIPEDFKPLFHSKKKSEFLNIGFISENLNNPYKGLQILLEALSLLPKENKIRLKLIGSGEAQVDASNFIVNQRYCKTNSEVIEQIQQCDLVVVPSIEDNSPSVVAESLMCGIPVIGSKVGGITEILSEFSLPSFERGNSQQLANLILNFQEVDSEELSKKAREFFSFEQIASSYNQLYEEMLTKIP